MDTLYRKVGKKYIDVGALVTNDIPKGLWFTQATEGGSRGTSISYWLGDLNIDKPINLELLVKLMSMDTEVCNQLTDDLNKNISNQDKALNILRLIYNKFR